MAILHRAQLVPSKIDLITPWLAAQSWAPAGEIAPIGAYRFDDRDGQVGVEGHLLAVGGTPVHVLTSYRGAPLDGADDFLIGTLEHSVLGKRWVYDAVADAVAVRELATVTLAGGTHADLVVVDEHEEEVERREPVVRLHGTGTLDPEAVSSFDGVSLSWPQGGVVTVGTEAYVIEIARVLDSDHPVSGTATLQAEWPGGSGILAAVTPR